MARRNSLCGESKINALLGKSPRDVTPRSEKSVSKFSRVSRKMTSSTSCSFESAKMALTDSGELKFAKWYAAVKHFCYNMEGGSQDTLRNFLLAFESVASLRELISSVERVSKELEEYRTSGEVLWSDLMAKQKGVIRFLECLLTVISRRYDINKVNLKIASMIFEKCLLEQLSEHCLNYLTLNIWSGYMSFYSSHERDFHRVGCNK